MSGPLQATTAQQMRLQSAQADDANRRLADALEAEAMGRLADQAREGIFGDYSSPLGSPKVKLVEILNHYGRDKLAKRVLAGEFDG